MLLAAQVPMGNGMLSPSGTDVLRTPIPSLHRPELINYLARSGGITASTSCGRSCCGR